MPKKNTINEKRRVIAIEHLTHGISKLGLTEIILPTKGRGETFTTHGITVHMLPQMMFDSVVEMHSAKTVNSGEGEWVDDKRGYNVHLLSVPDKDVDDPPLLDDQDKEDQREPDDVTHEGRPQSEELDQEAKDDQNQDQKDQPDFLDKGVGPQ